MDKKNIKQLFRKKSTSEQVQGSTPFDSEKEAEAIIGKHFDDVWNEVPEAFEEVDFQEQRRLFANVNAMMSNMQKKEVSLLTITLRYTAVVVIVMASLFILISQTDRLQTLSSEENISINKITKRTEKGQKLSVFLEDGSKVILNADSEITYAENFTENRTIELTGEAYFDVFKDKDAPFSVKSKGVKVIALGTAFNVQAYGKGSLIVSLESGKVSVSEIGKVHKNVELSPNEEVRITHENEWSKHMFDMQERMSWKEGVLYFNNSSLDEMLDKMEKWYGVTFEIQNYNKYEDNLYTGTFKKKSLESVLRAISYAKGFKYKITPDIVFIIY